VLVLWFPYALSQPADFLMVRVPETDVWFRTVRVPRGSRIRYMLSVNDPLGTMPPGAQGRKPVTDPLNPQGQMVELPGALPQPYYARREGVPRMAVQERKIVSTSLGQERRVLIYTPPGYDPRAKPYPSLYFFDGEDKDGLVFATSTLENLMAEGKIPPVVAVRIVNPSQAARGAQLSANAAFFDFLAKELVPYVRAEFRVSDKAEETLISGYSLGGLAATFAGLRHAEIFGLILSQSGSFWYEPKGDETTEPNWMAERFIASPKLPLRFYMDAGLFEADLSGRGSAILLPNRHLRDVLRAKGYPVRYQEFPGGHDYVNWRGTLADGLIDLLGGRQRESR
jgi:enterochelin esterase family protein